MAINFYETTIGRIGIEAKSDCISAVHFGGEQLTKDVEINELPIIKEAAAQLNRYFIGELKTFSIPLAPNGTQFMKEVWQLLCEIPYGETLTYKQVAEMIGRPNAARAVGLGCNRNPIPIFIPCHRVIGSNGRLVGYDGGLDIKEKLLDLEAKA